jgi:hypothetical protein
MRPLGSQPEELAVADQWDFRHSRHVFLHLEVLPRKGPNVLFWLVCLHRFLSADLGNAPADFTSRRPKAPRAAAYLLPLLPLFAANTLSLLDFVGRAAGRFPVLDFLVADP